MVTLSLVGLVLLIGASTGNLGFRGNTADANLAASADTAPRDVQLDAVTTSYWEDEDEDDERDHEDDHDGHDGDGEHEDDDEEHAHGEDD
jgi:hypothetical protein